MQARCKSVHKLVSLKRACAKEVHCLFFGVLGNPRRRDDIKEPLKASKLRALLHVSVEKAQFFLFVALLLSFCYPCGVHKRSATVPAPVYSSFLPFSTLAGAGVCFPPYWCL